MINQNFQDEKEQAIVRLKDLDQFNLSEKQLSHKNNIKHFEKFKNQNQAIIKEALSVYQKTFPILRIILQPYSAHCLRNQEKAVEGIVEQIRSEMKKYKQSVDISLYKSILNQNQRLYEQFPRLSVKQHFSVITLELLIYLDLLALFFGIDYLYRQNSEYFVSHNLEKQFQSLTSIDREHIKKLYKFYVAQVDHIFITNNRALQMLVLLLLLVKVKCRIHSFIKTFYAKQFEFLLNKQDDNQTATIIMNYQRNSRKYSIKFRFCEIYILLKEKEDKKCVRKYKQLKLLYQISSKKQEKEKKRLILQAKIETKLPFQTIFMIIEPLYCNKVSQNIIFMCQQEIFEASKETLINSWYMYLKYNSQTYRKKYNVDKRYDYTSQKKQLQYRLAVSCYLRHNYVHKIGQLQLKLQRQNYSLLVIHKYQFSYKQLRSFLNIPAQQQQQLSEKEYIITLVLAMIEESIVFFKVVSQRLKDSTYFSILRKQLGQVKIKKSFISVIVSDYFNCYHDWLQLNKFIHIALKRYNSRVYLLNFTSLSYYPQLVYSFLATSIKKIMPNLNKESFNSYCQKYIERLLVLMQNKCAKYQKSAS